MTRRLTLSFEIKVSHHHIDQTRVIIGETASAVAAGESESMGAQDQEVMFEKSLER